MSGFDGQQDPNLWALAASAIFLSEAVRVVLGHHLSWYIQAANAMLLAWVMLRMAGGKS